MEHIIDIKSKIVNTAAYVSQLGPNLFCNFMAMMRTAERTGFL